MSNGFGEFNSFDWRQPATGGLTWRMARQEDLPRLSRVWDQMEEKLGPQDRPDLFNWPVCLVLLAEDEAGEIVGGLYGEAVIDWTMIGADAHVARATTTLLPELIAYHLNTGIRAARVLVPMRLRRVMGRYLSVLTDLSDRFAHFAYRVRQ